MNTEQQWTLKLCIRCKGPFDKNDVYGMNELSVLCNRCTKIARAQWHIHTAHQHLKELGEPCSCEEFHRGSD